MKLYYSLFSCKYDFQLECLAKAHTDVELVTVTVADYDSEFVSIIYARLETTPFFAFGKGLVSYLSKSCSVCEESHATTRI